MAVSSGGFYDPTVTMSGLAKLAGHALVAVLSAMTGRWVATGGLMHAVHAATGAGTTPTGRADPPPPVDTATPVDPTSVPDPETFPHLNPLASTERAWVLAEGPTYEAGHERRFVTLTFDDGPFPETTPTVLDLLARYHVRATFFMLGCYLDGDDPRAALTRSVAKKVLLAGHIIGNHTHDHVELPAASRARALAQIDDGAASIERATGQRPVFFRPPYGLLDPWLEGAVRDRNLELVLRSVDADDMEKEDPVEIADDIIARIDYAEGGIVLLHDMHWPSVKALKRVLRWLDRHRYDPAHPEVRGYEIVDLLDYLRATRDAPQPYATHEEIEGARKQAHEARDALKRHSS